MNEATGDDVAGIDMKFGPNDEWTAHMTWREGDHNGPSRLIVGPTDPDRYPAGGISQTVLREIKFTDVIEIVRRGRETIAESADQSAAPIDWSAVGTHLSELSSGGISDSYLAALSWAYSAAANQPKPLERLAEISGKSAAAIKSHLWQATRRDLLYRSPGRAGGAATEKALKIIIADMEATEENPKQETGTIDVELPPLIRAINDDEKPKRRRKPRAITAGPKAPSTTDSGSQSPGKPGD